MKKFKVIITMIACFSEDSLYHEFIKNAKSEKNLSKKLKRQKWIKYSIKTQSKGIESTKTCYIQRSNIADIYISEVIE